MSAQYPRPKFFPHPEQATDVNDAARYNSPIILDVELHSDPGANGNYVQHGAATWAHEGIHGISTGLCLDNGCHGKDFFCAYYVLNGNYVKMPNPQKVTRTECVAHMPAAIRIGRYQHYFVDVVSHPAHFSPNYVLEEWNAYITGGSTAWEANEAGTWDQTSLTNTFQGPSEFGLFYAGCLAALLEIEPEYLQDDDVKGFLAWTYERAFDLYFKSRKYRDRFPGVEDEQYFHFIKDADGASARNALVTYFGQQWYDEVILNNVNVDTLPEPEPPQPDPNGPPPVATNPDEDVSREFDASMLNWMPLGLTKDNGPHGGGFSVVPVLPKGDIGTSFWSDEDCFGAVAKANNVTLLHFACDAPITDDNGDVLSLEAGQAVRVHGTGRIWDDKCGWGWLAEVAREGSDDLNWVRADALFIFNVSSIACDATITGVVPLIGETLPSRAPITGNALPGTASGEGMVSFSPSSASSVIFNFFMLLLIIMISF